MTSILTHRLNLELERCGWTEAYGHYAKAIASASKFDGTYDHHMAEFRRISNTWKHREAGEPNKQPASNSR